VINNKMTLRVPVTAGPIIWLDMLEANMVDDGVGVMRRLLPARREALAKRPGTGLATLLGTGEMDDNCVPTSEGGRTSRGLLVRVPSLRLLPKNIISSPLAGAPPAAHDVESTDASG
jgi:hypothetical protein